MKIWKRLLGLALCLCAAACVLCVGASAEGHSHPICGDTTKCTNPGHSGNHGVDVAWTEWDGTSAISYGTNNTAYICLTDTALPTNSIEVTGGQTLNLCLNGQGLTKSITVEGNATLNICDCQGGGRITLDSGSAICVTTVNGSNAHTTLNLYGGTISTDDTFDSGTIKLYNNDENNSQTVAVFNMYGGEVYNRDNGESAVYASYANIGTGYYEFNMYGGSITCEEGHGFEFNNNKNVAVKITGGTITGGWYGIYLSSQNTLTLAGNPKFIDKAYYSGTANIYIPDNVILTVTDDFTQANDAKISVEKSIGSAGSVLIAKPETGKSLDGKTQYFVSAKEGYFVECADSTNLQLTACAITEQPTAENSYTVTANGGSKAKYQWYSATRGIVPVTGNIAKPNGSASYIDWRAKWSAPLQNSTATVFTLSMRGGDVLTLDFSSNYEAAIQGVTLSDGTHTVDGVAEGWEGYTLTAPADGDYRLTVYATPQGEESSHTELSFAATVTADVPDMEKQCGGTSATLDTDGLASGSYICQVKWEGKTTRNSQAVTYTAQHTHSWSDEWSSDATHHWHECQNENCPVTENTQKDSYANHSGGTATCTDRAKCETCGAEYGDALGHNFVWKYDSGKHWKQCSRCDTTEQQGLHNLSKNGNTYTCTDCGYVYTVPSSSGGSSSTPTITVPVTGSRDTVQVSASVSGSTAEVKEIKKTELDKIGTDSDVVIDLSGLSKSVTGVTLPTAAIDSITDSEADGMTIKLPQAELRVDQKTLAAVSEQAKGSKVQLVVETDSKAKSTMTAAQKQALDGMKNAAALEAYFVSNGQRIRDFNGGEVELSIPYQASGASRAWYLKEDGTREPVSARYDKENARLILRHFSHYVIEELDSSTAYTVCAKDNTCPLAAFGDLTTTAWYHDGVHYCLENGLMQGVSTATFLPDGSTTRAQLVTILWRLEGSPETTGTTSFGDVADGAWYAKAVRWAAGSGVVKGYDSEHFGPDDAVTREQMVTILYRYAQYKGYDVSVGEDTNILSYNDALTVSEYAIPAMQWACGSGLVTGIAREDGMFLAPADTTVRVQTATLMMRFPGALAKTA